ncbi:MAG: cold-inducible protein YdjO-related protein [Firmicutes bacterium]|nr:cold-inducible protein YdjO-related protein [Bacillota bacterium]
MAYFNNRKPTAEHVYEDTVIWQCSSCNCWSRKEFIAEFEPTCPICHSKMNEETKKIRVQ